MKAKRNSNSKLFAYFFVCVVIVVGIVFTLQNWDKDLSGWLNNSKTSSHSVTKTSFPKPATRTPLPTPRPSPVSVELDMLFFSQAPSGDWSLPWQEACEEASVILVGAYLTHEQLTTEIMERHILDAVKWEQERFGFYEHTTAKQTAEMMTALYGFSDVRVEYDVGIERIEEHLRAGRPVIVPMAGRLLGNPYYTQSGPVYHMLVVKGIASNGDIITNDVGTRRGKNFLYSPNVFLNAMHDAPAGGSSRLDTAADEQWIESGRRAIIVVYPS